MHSFFNRFFARPALTESQAKRAAEHLVSFAAVSNLPDSRVIKYKRQYCVETILERRVVATFRFQ